MADIMRVIRFIAALAVAAALVAPAGAVAAAPDDVSAAGVARGQQVALAVYGPVCGSSELPDRKSVV